VALHGLIRVVGVRVDLLGDAAIQGVVGVPHTPGHRAAGVLERDVREAVAVVVGVLDPRPAADRGAFGAVALGVVLVVVGAVAGQAVVIPGAVAAERAVAGGVVAVGLVRQAAVVGGGKLAVGV